MGSNVDSLDISFTAVVFEYPILFLSALNLRGMA